MSDRDGISPVRSNDLFFGGGSEDWVNLDKVRVPQADEQQRLLANLIIQMNLDRMPLPRFWYLPHGHKAAVVMTGDDHGNGGVGTHNHFDRLRQQRPARVLGGGLAVHSGDVLRVLRHLRSPGPRRTRPLGSRSGCTSTTSCSNFTPASIAERLEHPARGVAHEVPRAFASPRTNRTHCIVWSDWVSEATAARVHGIRLDTNYYYWPASWISRRPGHVHRAQASRSGSPTTRAAT